MLPEFILHDAAVNRWWGGLFDRFPGFQIAVLDGEHGVVAAGNSVPLFWDETLDGLPDGVGETVERGLTALIAPVRPTLKERYPLIPMEDYVRWRRGDGLPFDPWLRVHRRLGAKFLRVAPRSMRITGSIAGWEGWTGMRFPVSGPYVVPGALCPVEMDVERDLGTYEEPNVRMCHPLAAV